MSGTKPWSPVPVRKEDARPTPARSVHPRAARPECQECARAATPHRDDIDRVAIVTDDTAASMVAKAAEALPGIATETFSSQDEPRAWGWLE